jgi:tripartite-type tricarboxylate transporter receptor subunit TctC
MEPTVIRRRDALKLALAAPVALAGGRAFAQAWPAKPVQIIIPFGAGGGSDTACRIIFQRVSEKLGQPFVIENRTGGASVVAAQAVLNLPKDGHTFLVNSTQQLITPVLVKDMPFDFKTAFVPVTRLTNFPQVVAVREDSAMKTMQDFVGYAKANPGKLRYGTPPTAGMGQLAGILIELRTGIKCVNVPYRSAPDAPRDMLSGNLDAVLLTTSTIGPHVQSGRARVIAVTSSTRNKLYPNVPTIAEQIIPGYDMDDWNGVFAAAGTPEPLVEKMQAALAEACADPAVTAKLDPLGTIGVGSATAPFAKFMEEQRVILTNIIREANITAG